jgi:hypothetical protein
LYSKKPLRATAARATPQAKFFETSANRQLAAQSAATITTNTIFNSSRRFDLHDSSILSSSVNARIAGGKDHAPLPERVIDCMGKDKSLPVLYEERAGRENKVLATTVIARTHFCKPL